MTELSLLHKSPNNKNKEDHPTKPTPWIIGLVGFAVGSLVTFIFCVVLVLILYGFGNQVNNASIDVSVTYTRWGKKRCPDATELVYSGQVGGNHYASRGGGVNYLCLPNDPENGKHQPFKNNGLYGAEYQIFADRRPSGMSLSLGNKEIPCAVCNRKKRSSAIMIPGRKTCYKGWTSEYRGYLMSDSSQQSNKDYVCVDKAAEALDNKASNNDHALFVPIRTRCGSLRCPPYTDEADVHCVVCSF